jgi:hypothetical protein
MRTEPRERRIAALLFGLAILFGSAPWLARARGQDLIDVEVQVVDQNDQPIPNSKVLCLTNGQLYQNGSTFVFPAAATPFDFIVIPGIGGLAQNTPTFDSQNGWDLQGIRLYRGEQRTLPGDPNGVTFRWNTAQVTFDQVRDQNGTPIDGSKVFILNIGSAAAALNAARTPSAFSAVDQPKGHGLDLPFTITLPVNDATAMGLPAGSFYLGGSYANGYDLGVVPAIGGPISDDDPAFEWTPMLWRLEGETADHSPLLPPDMPARMVSGDTTFAFSWQTRDVTFDMVDQFGNALPNSTIQILGQHWARSLNLAGTPTIFSSVFVTIMGIDSYTGTPFGRGAALPATVTLPINQGYPEIHGPYSAAAGDDNFGYDLALMPAIDGNEQIDQARLLRYEGIRNYNGGPATEAIVVPPSTTDVQRSVRYTFIWEIRSVALDLVEAALRTRIEGSEIRILDAAFAKAANLAGTPTPFSFAWAPPYGPGIPVAFTVPLPVTEGYAAMNGGYKPGYPFWYRPAVCGTMDRSGDASHNILGKDHWIERIEIPGSADRLPSLFLLAARQEERASGSLSKTATTLDSSSSTDGSTATTSTTDFRLQTGDLTVQTTDATAEKSGFGDTAQTPAYPAYPLTFTWDVDPSTGIPKGLEEFAKEIGCTGTTSAPEIADQGGQTLEANPPSSTDDGGIADATPDEGGVYNAELHPFLLSGAFGLGGCLDGALRPLAGGSMAIHNTNLTAFNLGVDDGSGAFPSGGEALIDTEAGTYAALLERDLPTEPPTLLSYAIESIRYNYDGGAKWTEIDRPEPPTTAFDAPAQGDLTIDLARSDLQSVFFAVKITSPCARASGLRFRVEATDGSGIAEFASLNRIETGPADFSQPGAPLTSPDAAGAAGFVASTTDDGFEFVMAEVLLPPRKGYRVVNAAIEFMDPQGRPLNELVLPGGDVPLLAATPRQEESAACPRLVLWNEAQLPSGRIEGELDLHRTAPIDPTVTSYLPGFFHYTDLNQLTGNVLGYRPNGAPKTLLADTTTFQPTPYDYVAVPEGRYWPGLYASYWTAALKWPESFGPGARLFGGVFAFPTPGNPDAIEPLDQAGSESRGIDPDGLFYVDGKDPETLYDFSPCDPLHLHTEEIDFQAPMAFVGGKILLGGCIGDLAVAGGQASLGGLDRGLGRLFQDERGYRRRARTGDEFGRAWGIFAGDGHGTFEIAAVAGPWLEGMYNLRLIQGKNADEAGYYNGWLGFLPANRRRLELSAGRENALETPERKLTTGSVRIRLRVVNEDGSLRPFRDAQAWIGSYLYPTYPFSDPQTGESGKYYAISFGSSTEKTEHLLTIAGLGDSTVNISLRALIRRNPDGTGPLLWAAFPMLKNVPIEAGKCGEITIDLTPPEITCPPEVTAPTDAGLCSASLEVGAPAASDDQGGAITIEGTRSDGAPLSDPFATGTTTITWTATDAAGNQASCTQSITVIDAEAPRIECPQELVLANDPGSCSAIARIEPPQAFDNCGIARIAAERGDKLTLDDPFPVGTTWVFWTAWDIHGNASSCAQSITVTDAEAPRIECPKELVLVNDPGKCSAIARIEAPQAFDNCGIAQVAAEREDKLTLGDPFPVGTTRVLWTAWDIHGNRSSCTETIIVKDAEAPKILAASFASAVIAPAAGSCKATVPAAMVSASDNCGDAKSLKIEQSPAPGTIVGPGTYDVTITVTDPSGNAAKTTLTLTVLPRLRLIFYEPPIRDDNLDDDIETDADAINQFKVGHDDDRAARDGPDRRHRAARGGGRLDALLRRSGGVHGRRG